jgi:hypothetical protein
MMADELPGAGREALDRVVWVLRLAIGMPDEGRPASWEGILDTAVDERCAALAWARSGERIRRQAPAGEVARWRAFAVANDAHSRLQQSALREALDALAGDGVQAVVLKGAPLSFRLYGDGSARTTDDIDVYVPVEARDLARRTLLALGWRAHFSESMLDDCYARPGGDWHGGELFLEVHTALVSELLAHARLREPVVEWCPSSDGELPALAGPALPVYLAAHLAKHQLPSLLWHVDFATLWRSLDAAERHDAEALARRARLSKWLDWAVRRASLLEPAARGDVASLRALGFAPGGRCVTHGIREFIAHSDSPIDAARVLGAIIWPRHLRGDVPAFVALSARRVRARVQGAR